MSESSDIIQYLEKQYPSPPRVIVPGTLAFEIAYYKYFIDGVGSKLPKSIYPHLYEIISPEAAARLKVASERVFEDTLENIAKNSQSYLDAYRDAYGTIAFPIYEKAEGNFLKGSEPGWGDFVTASYLLTIKLLYGAESKEWKFIEAWHEGRWVKLIKDLEPYAYIDE